VVERRNGGRGLNIEPPPLRLVAVAYYDRHEKKVLDAPATACAHFWPGAYDLIPDVRSSHAVAATRLDVHRSPDTST
jgi:hypothetical protein